MKIAWLVSGLRSAIFFYVSCGPCNQGRNQRKRRKEAKAIEKRNAEWLEQHPRGHHQPAPFQTNKYWEEDIALGPIRLPKRKRARTKETNARARAISSAGSTGTGRGESPRPGSLVKKKKRWQRPAEEFDVETVTRRDDWDYHRTKAPPVNDMHPAIVSMLPAKSEDRWWMTASPPSTSFMRGNAIPERSGTQSTVQSKANQAGMEGPSTLAPGFSSTRSPRKQRKHRPKNIAIPPESTTEDSDADDEDDEAPSPHVRVNPRSLNRADVASLPKSVRMKQSGRPSLATIPSYDTRSPKPSPFLRPRPNSEEVSPKTISLISSRPNTSFSASPSSSDHEDSLHPPLPNFARSRSQTTPTAMFAVQHPLTHRVRKDSGHHHFEPHVRDDSALSVDHLDHMDTEHLSQLVADIDGLTREEVRDRIQLWQTHSGLVLDGLTDEQATEALWEWAADSKKDRAARAAISDGRRWSADMGTGF